MKYPDKNYIRPEIDQKFEFDEKLLEPRQLIFQVVNSLEQKRIFLHNYVVLLYHNLAAKFGFYWQPDDIFDIFKGPGDPCHWPEVATA